MPSQSAILTAVLASTDALWTPLGWRGEESRNAAAATSERRDQFGSRGVPFVGGGDESQRKSIERILKEMVSAGLIRLHGGNKRIGVSLTDHGDDVARSLTLGYLARDSFPLLAQIERGRSACGGETNAGFTLEVDVLHPPTSYERVKADRLSAFRRRSLPLLARGWIESWSDSVGCIGYRVSTAGMNAKRPKCARLPDYESSACDAYERQYQESLSDRDSWIPRDRTLVAIPLSAGMWPERRKR